MKKVSLKQGTLLWEKAKATRIGSSEVFDIVRYYASDEELQNCGINAEDFRNESPYTTAWALYHKVINDGIYKKEALAPEYAEYGHAVEPYGVHCLQKHREKKLKPGVVYVDDRLIASLDIMGVSEDVDTCVDFSWGKGSPKKGQKFVCEQKSMFPIKVKGGIPFKYIVQAQYQIEMTKAKYFVLQIMVLKEDTPFIRGKICQMSKPTRFKYLDENMEITNLYFKSNIHLGELIRTCLSRFFDDVDNKKEPTPYIETDTQRNIIESIRINSEFRPDATKDFDLSVYAEAKKNETEAEEIRKAELQKIIEFAKENNACNFVSTKGKHTAKFSKSGSFLIKSEEEVS